MSPVVPADSQPPPEPTGPPAAFWALSAAATAEHDRRIRRATLIPVAVGLLGVFALGASILPDALTNDLVVGYLVFLAVYGTALAMALLRVTAGPYGRALSVAAIAHNGTLRVWKEATGEATPPATPADAVAWLQRHGGREGISPQRLSAQVLAGDLVGAREPLAQYPRATPFERYWLAADAWFLDVLEGRAADLAAVEVEVSALADPALRAHAESGLATLRAYQAAAAGGDWIAPLASIHDRVAPFADQSWRQLVVVRLWTLHMAAAALLIGGALLIGRVTGVWR